MTLQPKPGRELPPCLLYTSESVFIGDGDDFIVHGGVQRFRNESRANALNLVGAGHAPVSYTHLWKCGKGYVNEQGMERLYRPNVAGMMVRQDGKLLICERSG